MFYISFFHVDISDRTTCSIEIFVLEIALYLVNNGHPS